MIRKIIEPTSRFARKVVRKINAEKLSSSYLRLITLTLYTVIVYLLMVIMFLGASLKEKVLISNPENTILSDEAIKLIVNLNIAADYMFILSATSLLIVIYKLYREIRFRKSIKLLKLDVIK